MFVSGCAVRSFFASSPTVNPSLVFDGEICTSPASLVSGISDFATLELNGPDHRQHRAVGDERLDVLRAGGRIVDALHRIVEEARLELVGAAGEAVLVGLLDRQHRAVLRRDPDRGIGAADRQVDADLDDPARPAGAGALDAAELPELEVEEVLEHAASSTATVSAPNARANDGNCISISPRNASRAKLRARSADALRPDL